MLIALGSVTFACCVTLSYPLYAAEALADVLPSLAPALTLLGAPILVAGAMIHHKLRLAGEGETHGLWRTLGTGLALTGMVVMFGGFAVSIDDTVLRWLCGSINIGTLLAVAWVMRMPMLNVPVQVYLAVLFVYSGHFDFDLLTQQPTIALRLSGLLVLQALVAEGLIRLERRVDALFFAIGSGGFDGAGLHCGGAVCADASRRRGAGPGNGRAHLVRR